MKVEELMESMVGALLDEGRKVVVECIRDEDEIIFRIYVAPDDTGKVIGKQGRTARALRTILGGIGMARRQRYVLDIVEVGRQNEGSHSEPVGRGR